MLYRVNPGNLSLDHAGVYGSPPTRKHELQQVDHIDQRVYLSTLNDVDLAVGTDDTDDLSEA